MKYLTLALLIGLSACGATLSSIETSLSGAEVSAETYSKLQPCTLTINTMCSKYSVVQDIGTAREAARTAILAAREAGTQDSIDAAQTALDAIKAILAQDGVKDAISSITK
jgi:multidrug resistance efflux pump